MSNLTHSSNSLPRPPFITEFAHGEWGTPKRKYQVKANLLVLDRLPWVNFLMHVCLVLQPCVWVENEIAEIETYIKLREEHRVKVLISSIPSTVYNGRLFAFLLCLLLQILLLFYGKHYALRISDLLT